MALNRTSGLWHDKFYMYKNFPVSLKQAISTLLMIVSAAFALFYWQGHQGFSLWDEGFLWYGAQRTLEGEVPMRDFQAYDIGRYYWSAAFMSLWGNNGIVALRMSTAIFQAIALYVSLSVLRRSATKQNFIFWLLTTVTLLAWMAPQYRLFDISIPVLLVSVFAFLVAQPSRRRYFLTGLVVGLAAVFGRNHGLYGVVGSVSLMAYLTIRREGGVSLISACTAWASGIVVGYLPVLVFFAVVPGFAQAFVDGILLLFDIKGTNYSVPIPWPWLVPFEKLSTVEALHGVGTGIFFIAIATFGVLGAIWIIRQWLQNKAVSPVLAAAIFFALPYTHYAYSRADLSHLAPGIPPFLMGVTALLTSQSAKIKWSFAVLLCGASLLVMFPRHPGLYCYFNQHCVDIKVGRDQLKVDGGTATNLAALNRLAEQFAPGDRTFITTPFWSGAYAALGRKSPMWEIFASTPRSAVFQQAEVERIKAAHPGFAIIDDSPFDGRDDLRFHNTHPIIDQYIRDNFQPLNNTVRNPAFQIYISKQAGQ